MGRWELVIGRWTFLSGDSNTQATWRMIWDDGYQHAHQFGGFVNALNQSIQTNIPIISSKIQDAVSRLVCSNASAQVDARTVEADINIQLHRQLLQLPPHDPQILLMMVAGPLITVGGITFAVARVLENLPQNATLNEAFMDSLGKSRDHPARALC